MTKFTLVYLQDSITVFKCKIRPNCDPGACIRMVFGGTLHQPLTPVPSLCPPDSVVLYFLNTPKASSSALFLSGLQVFLRNILSTTLMTKSEKKVF